eukprot:6269974-Amphidinium_carterae.2
MITLAKVRPALPSTGESPLTATDTRSPQGVYHSSRRMITLAKVRPALDTWLRSKRLCYLANGSQWTA